MFWEKRIRLIRPIHIFLMCSALGIVLYFAFCIFGRQHMLQWLAMGNHSVSLCDYFMPVRFAAHRDKIYGISTDSQFPPFAYILFYYIMRITSNGPFPEVSTEELRVQPYQLMVFLMFLAVGIFLLVRAIDEIKVSKIEHNLLSLVIIFSTPVFAGAIERGNTVLHVAAMVILSFYWKDSEVKWKREAALLLIAISAGLKIYPAFMGILYLKEKRWKESFRLIVYGMFIFFGPFIFFGGIPTIIEYVQRMSGLMSNSYSGRFQFIKGVLSCLGIEGRCAIVCSILFVSSLIGFFFKTSNEIRRMTYMASMMALVPGNAFRYSLMFFLLPLCVLVGKEKDSCVWEDYIDAVLLGMIFTIPTIFGIITGFKLGSETPRFTYVELRIYMVVWGFLFFQFFCDLYDWGKAYRKNEKLEKIL